jgi:hypothetical protein
MVEADFLDTHRPKGSGSNPFETIVESVDSLPVKKRGISAYSR